MNKSNYAAVFVAAVAAFFAAFIYYSVLGDQYAEFSAAARAAAASGPQAWQVAAEFGRNLVVAIVVAWLAARTGVANMKGVAQLAIVLWVGFPIVLWAGAIVHENTPVQSAAIHAGDWLLKLLVVTPIVGVWRRRRS